MKGFTSKKSFLRLPEGGDPLLPILSLMLLILPILIGHISFGDLRMAEVLVAPRSPSSGNAVPRAVAPSDSVLFHLTLGTGDHLTELVEEATGKRLSRLRLAAGKLAPDQLRTELTRLQRKYAKLDTVLIQTAADVPYESFVEILGALQAPSPGAPPPPQIVLLPSGGL